MDSSSLDTASMMGTVSALMSTWGLKVVGAIAVLIVGVIVAKMIRGTARKAFVRSDMDATLVPFLSGIIYYLVLGCVLIAVMGMFGIQTTSFIAVLGAAGLAIGLALQGTLSNFAAGVMILIFRPFRAGDFVNAAGESGTVKEVGVFSTTMSTGDNVKIIVPNSAIYGSTIKNFSANDTRRVDLVIGVGYGDDLQLAMDTMTKILGSDERVLSDPPPQVAVSELADSSVNFVVRPWCDKNDYWGLRFDLTRRIKEQLEAAGCSIPFPQQDVHMHQVASPTA